MADPQTNEKTREDSGRSVFTQGPLNTAKVVLNKVGFKFHTYRTSNRELPVRNRLQSLITLLHHRMVELDKCETEFEIIENLMPELAEAYKNLGPYTTKEICTFFKKYYSEGWVDQTKGESTLSHHVVDSLPITIRNPADHTEHTFKIFIPRAREVLLPDGYIEGGLVVFGYSPNNMDMWATYYTQKAQEILDYFKPTLVGHEGMLAHLGVIKTAVMRVLEFQLLKGERRANDDNIALESIYGKDKRSETFFSKALRGLFESYDSYRATLFKHVPPRCDHTYKVIQPVLFDVDGTILDDVARHGFIAHKGKITPDGEKIVDELRPGLDHLGKPLEVTERGYVYVDTKRFPDDQSKWRSVDKSFIRELPLHEIAAYLANEWDSYRDDLRDGRWHSKSLTVIEYIQSVVPALGNEWKTKLVNEIPSDQFRRPKTQDYKMRIRDGTTEKWIHGVRAPSQTNPSFDLRAFTPKFLKGISWSHAGRLFYYDDVGGLRGNKEPHISSRGLSMFIIDRICSEGKSLAEIRKELQIIAKEVGGFDYGPRKMKGSESFCMDPFEINLNPVIESIQKKSKT
ncbi:MAG: hypothetical protein O2779_02560 [Nanoarchaeota archaeon]|nr:hypothetical protein [Nanoarchaeota archaeon]